MSPGVVVASSLLFELVVWPVLGLSGQWSQMQASVGAFARISAWFNLRRRAAADDLKQDSPQSAEIMENKLPILILEQVTVMDEAAAEPFWIGLQRTWHRVNWLR